MNANRVKENHRLTHGKWGGLLLEGSSKSLNGTSPLFPTFCEDDFWK